MFFALEEKWTSLQISPQRRHPLPQTGQARTPPRGIFLLPPLAAIVEDLGSDRPGLVSQLNTAMLRAAVADHVRYPFAHRPGECGIQSSWKGLLEGFDLCMNPCRFQELPGSFQFA